MSTHLYVLGTGGFAREMRGLAISCGIDGERVKLVPKEAEQYMPEGSELMLGVGSPPLRRELYRRHSTKNSFATWRHPASSVGEGCQLGAGTVIAAGSIITVDVSLGLACLVNLSCTVGHGCSIGDFVVVNPLTAIAGNVTVEDRVLIGSGASIIEEVRIGEGAVVGAGAVVIDDVAPGVTVVGVPARPVRSR